MDLVKSTRQHAAAVSGTRPPPRSGKETTNGKRVGESAVVRRVVVVTVIGAYLEQNCNRTGPESISARDMTATGARPRQCSTDESWHPNDHRPPLPILYTHSLYSAFFMASIE